MEPHGILHLCSATSATTLLVDKAHRHKTSNLDNDIKVIEIPSYWDHKSFKGAEQFNQIYQLPDIAYFVHTSGTSSGLPKAIPQTHHGLIGALPCLSSDTTVATFTTTPLYHGGLVDCFRAWTSGAMIWFFPEGAGPITALNLQRAVDFARSHSSSDVKYFTAVPYILQILAEEDYGVQLLRTMDLVAFGGAALPTAVGDRLVEAGVHLLSRLGSAECGFLMSSHRDYSRDKAWQYLRPTDDVDFLEFENSENGLSELVVKSLWPCKVKVNRDDGSYATSDLFEPHNSIPNAWRYHSRADAQITLANGKKFDPAPIEASILAGSKMLADVLVFGNGKEYPGALLFPASDHATQDTVASAVWPLVEEMNRSTQSHARLARSMLVVVHPEKGQSPLKKSSKGTILRPQAEKRYAEAIDSAYGGENFIAPSPEESCGRDLLSTVMECFSRVLGHKVDPEKDLYHQGVDSIASSQIRTLIETACLPQTNLPLNIIYDQGTVVSLVAYLQQLRSGEQLDGPNEPRLQIQLMRELAAKYSHLKSRSTDRNQETRNSVVLTGSTGFLGAHILKLLREDCRVDKIFCLVRAPTTIIALDRVSQSLQKFGFLGLRDSQGSDDQDSKVVCLPCDLSSPSLGLSHNDRQRMMKNATIYIHSAWTVNFNLSLQSFEDQMAGTRYLLDTALEGGAHFVFISSTAAVSHANTSPVVERLSDVPTDASPLGYGQSKWVAEQICAAADVSMAPENANRRPTSIIRVGQLCANDTGVWNASEAYPLMLSTANITHCLPSLNNTLDWLPVDTAARAIVEIIFPQGAQTGGSDQMMNRLVYHVFNPCKTPTWAQMLQWLSDETNDYFEVVSPPEWLERLEEQSKLPGVSHPSQALLGFWKMLFARETRNVNENDPKTDSPEFEISSAMAVSETMRSVRPLGRHEVIKMWRWIRDSI